MILIADSGSTHTDWVFIEKDEHEKKYQTAGFNPYYVPSHEMVNSLEKNLVPFVNNGAVRYVYFYGSGCSTDKKRFIVEEALGKVFPNAHTEVNHDLLGAARGLFNDRPGIACILGTGSNSCLYDGTGIRENIPSLGYFFGDEGSSAHIGRLFLTALLRKDLPVHILEEFEEAYSYNLEDILDAVYNQPRPNRFLGSFMPFIAGYREDPMIHALIFRSFDEFIQEQVIRYTDYQDYTVSYVGSVAYHMKNLLTNVARQYDLSIGDIHADPLDGLIKYHQPDILRYIGMGDFDR